MTRRHRLDIMAEMLTLTKNGCKVTRLVYQANLNFTIIKRYIAILLKHGLVRQDDEIYFSTDKGDFFVERYDELMGGLGLDSSTEM